MKYLKLSGLMLLAASTSYDAAAFENTDMLPKGIRRVQIKTAHTTIDEKTNRAGKGLEVSDPLQKTIRFSDVIKEEKPLRQNQIRSTLQLFGYEEQEIVGQMNAQMEGKVSVVAPVFAYGVSDKWNIAIGIPYYRAEMGVELGFEATDRGQAFLNDISNPKTNQVKSARDAGEKFNNAVANLNDDLADNDFDTLNTWEGSGIGDITLASKNLIVNNDFLKFASVAGVLLPTGATDDPDNLIDIPFGDGTYDVFYTAILDQQITKVLKFNQFAKYTYQHVATREMRLETPDESIEVQKDDVRYKLGDKVEFGISAQYTDGDGIEAGIGASHDRRYADRFFVDDDAVKEKLEEESDSNATFAQVQLGYSSVPAYKRKQIAVPFKAVFGYKKHLESRNSYTNDLLTFDVSLFF